MAESYNVLEEILRPLIHILENGGANAQLEQSHPVTESVVPQALATLIGKRAAMGLSTSYVFPEVLVIEGYVAVVDPRYNTVSIFSNIGIADNGMLGVSPSSNDAGNCAVLYAGERTPEQLSDVKARRMVAIDAYNDAVISSRDEQGKSVPEERGNHDWSEKLGYSEPSKLRKSANLIKLHWDTLVPDPRLKSMRLYMNPMKLRLKSMQLHLKSVIYMKYLSLLSKNF